MTSPRHRLAASRWWRRTRLVIMILGFVLLNPWTAATAAAKQGGTTPTLWSWMGIEDTRGNSAWGYGLSLDQGGWTDAGKAIFGGLASLLWTIYQFGVIFCFWFIDWVFSFTWLTPIVAPVRAFADALADLLARLGLVPTLMLFAGLTIVLLLLKGAWAAGLYELVLTLVVLAVSTGVMAHPVDVVAGPNGMLYQSKDAGLQLAAELGSDGTKTNQTPDEARKQMISELVDIFLRTPHQLINYGMVLDGTRCEKAYNTSIEGIPRPPSFGEEPSKAYTAWAKKNNVLTLRQGVMAYEFFTPREIVADCNSAAGKVAEHPGPGMTVSALSLLPAAGLLLLLSLVMAGLMFFFTLLTLWCAVRFIWAALIALCGGNARGGLWQTISHATMAMFGVAVFSVVLVGYLSVINQTVQNMSKTSVMAAIIMLDGLLLVGIVLFWKLRKQLTDAADRLSKALSKRPGSLPSTLPKAGGGQLNKTHALKAARLGQSATAKTAGGTVKGVKTGAKVGGAAATLGMAVAWAGGAKVGKTLTRGSKKQPPPAVDNNEPSGPGAGPSPNNGPALPPGNKPSLTGPPARAQLEARTRGTGHGSRGVLPPPPHRSRTQHKTSAVRRPTTARYQSVRQALADHASPGRGASLNRPAANQPSPTHSRTAGRKYQRVIKDGTVVLVPVDKP